MEGSGSEHQFLMTSGSRLRRAREAAGFKHASVAARQFGWPVSTYASHENGQTKVPVDDAEKYASAFRVCSAAWILTGEGDPPPGEQRRAPRPTRGKDHPGEGERVEIATLPSDLAAMLAPLLAGGGKEIWRLDTENMAAAQYHSGDFLLVDRLKNPIARDIVLARDHKRHIVRVFFPPYLVAAPSQGAQPTITVDNVSVLVLGVVVGKFTAT